MQGTKCFWKILAYQSALNSSIELEWPDVPIFVSTGLYFISWRAELLKSMSNVIYINILFAWRSIWRTIGEICRTWILLLNVWRIHNYFPRKIILITLRCAESDWLFINSSLTFITNALSRAVYSNLINGVFWKSYNEFLRCTINIITLQELRQLQFTFPGFLLADNFGTANQLFKSQELLVDGYSYWITKIATYTISQFL